MQNDSKERLTIINRLLASFPSTQSGQGDDALDGYLIGTAEVPVQFLAVAAQRFLAGKVEGHNLAFPPSPAQLAHEASKHWDRQLRLDALDRPQIEGPKEPEIGEDERARVKAKFDAYIAGVQDTKTPERTEEDRAYWQKVNDYFKPDMEPTAMRRRLRLTRPDDADEGDMGGQAA